MKKIIIGGALIIVLVGGGTYVYLNVQKQPQTPPHVATTQNTPNVISANINAKNAALQAAAKKMSTGDLKQVIITGSKQVVAHYGAPQAGDPSWESLYWDIQEYKSRVPNDAQVAEAETSLETTFGGCWGVPYDGQCGE